MTNYVAFMTYMYEPYLKDCLATLKLPRKNLMLVDGRLPNDGGCAWAINLGIDFMKRQKAEWLILINPAMRFGDAGGLDMLDALDATGANLIYFTDHTGNEFAWHCCAINRRVFDAIGKLDTNFKPVYFEDVDYNLRYKKYFGNKGIRSFPIDARNESIGHSTELAGVKPDLNYLITYFATKWGIHPSAVDKLASYANPFNDKKNGLAFWPPANGGIWND